MMQVFKLTDCGSYTRRSCLWGEGVTHKTSGKPANLCSEGFLHFYHSAEMAMVMNLIHGDYDPRTMILWEAVASGTILNDNGLKGGSTELTTIRRIEKPVVSPENMTRFAVLCSLLYTEGYGEFIKWGYDWLTKGSMGPIPEGGGISHPAIYYTLRAAEGLLEKSQPETVNRQVCWVMEGVGWLAKDNHEVVKCDKALDDVIKGRIPLLHELRNSYVIG